MKLQKNSKIGSALWTNTHLDVKSFEVDGIVKKIKKSISEEQNITFPWKKKSFGLCIFRYYHFNLVDVRY